MNKTKKPEIKPKADTNKKPSIDFVKFLELCKKNAKLSIGEVTKANNTKILLVDGDKKKIVFYVKSSKKFGTVCWSNVEKKNLRISNKQEFENLIKTLPEMKK